MRLCEFIRSDNECTEESHELRRNECVLEMTETDSAVTEAGRSVSENL